MISHGVPYRLTTCFTGYVKCLSLYQKKDEHTKKDVFLCRKLKFVSEMDIRKYDVQRVRRGFSLSSDYIFNENNRIDF